MIGTLRNLYSNQTVIRGVKVDRLLQNIYARWLGFGNTGRIFTVFAEISSKCNLACENCYRTGNNYLSKNHNMSFDTFKKIVDAVPPNIHYLVTQGFGESAFNPEFKQMLRYARLSRKFKTIVLDSNLLLKNADYYQSLFDDGLDRLIVSVDSFDPSICDILRNGTDVYRLLGNLTQVRKKHRDHLHVRTTVSKININDLENTLTTLKNLEISRVEIGMIVDYRHSGIALDARDKEKVMVLIKKYEKSINLLLDYYNICILPFTAICFNAKGNLMPCCRIFDDEIINFGNIDSGIENAYHSDRFQKTRATFFKKMPFFCKGCHHYRKI